MAALAGRLLAVDLCTAASLQLHADHPGGRDNAFAAEHLGHQAPYLLNARQKLLSLPREACEMPCRQNY